MTAPDVRRRGIATALLLAVTGVMLSAAIVVTGVVAVFSAVNW